MHYIILSTNWKNKSYKPRTIRNSCYIENENRKVITKIKILLLNRNKYICDFGNKVIERTREV